MFKQDHFAFVDVISLIFLVVLFMGNFYGLLYLTSGSILISFLISAFIIILYYTLIQILKRNKQSMVTQHYRTPFSLLFLIFGILAIGSFVLMSHALNIETNAKPKVQAEVAQEIAQVEKLSSVYQERVKKNLQDYEGELTKLLSEYKKKRTATLKDALSTDPYTIDPQILASFSKNIDVAELAKAKIQPYRVKAQENEKDITTRITQAQQFNKAFEEWKWLRVTSDYKKLNQYITESYSLVNEKLSQLPMQEEPLTYAGAPKGLPLDSFWQLNKHYTPNYLIPLLVVVVIHLFILIPYFTYKVRAYVGKEENQEDKRVTTY
jgi:hypothetical protein